MSEDTGTLRVDGREIPVSNLEKVFFPEAGITKGDVIEYYRDVADVMLPHLRDRPLTMHRFPEGLRTEGFYAKNLPEYFPEWIERATLEKVEGGETTYVLCQDAATLVYVANQATVTPHVWLSRADRPRRPDRIIFDLDPPDDGARGLELVKEGARGLREILEELELAPFLMTTGSRGFHVTVPVERRNGFDETRAFARRVADLLARGSPGRFTTAQRKARRGGRLYLDTGRNAYGQTGVAPYAVRARPGAPVATPLDWDELSSAEPRSYTVENLLRRLGQREDPWGRIGDAARPLGGPRKRLEALTEEEEGEEGGKPGGG